MNWASVVLVCFVLLGSRPYAVCADITENTIRVESFLVNVNFSEPKLFYVRNNLDGDIIFQENENASLMVYVAANDEEMERVKVEYNLVDEGSIVDIQVYIVPETTSNWPLIGGLLAACACTCLAIFIALMYVLRKRRLHSAAKQGGKVQAKRNPAHHDNLAFELEEKEETQLEEHVASQQPDLELETSDGKEETALEENVANQQPQPGTSGGEGKTPLEQNLANQQPQTGNRPGLSTMGIGGIGILPFGALTLLTLVAITMATVKAPTARIVINVPANFVKNGSKMFFNKDFHGRLLLSEDLKTRILDFKQFDISQSSNKASSLHPCFASCKFACDVQTQKCVCLRGYEMKEDSCRDVDECSSLKHNCPAHSTCNNTIGGFICSCSDGYWGDEFMCHACSISPCPKGFYQSEPCTRTRDRVCTACSPKCDGMSYQAYGCGLTFDRKCVDISKPLTVSKIKNDSNLLEVRLGTKLVVLNPGKDLVLLENRLRLTSSSATLLLKRDSPRIRFHRNSDFYVDLEVMKVNLVPKYNDYDAFYSNENHEFARVDGFQEVQSKHCRYPAPNHYTIKHELEQDRKTKVYPATCFEHSRDLCPRDVAPGETYYYRSLNDECETSEEPAICRKPHQKSWWGSQSYCKLQEVSNKLYCTNYTNFVTDIFGIKESEFLDSPLQTFPTVDCATAFQKCRVCRDGCSDCGKLNNLGDRSCSCCYKDCLVNCTSYYRASCTQMPKQCAKGDTSRFTLTMNKPTNLNLQFNCFLEYTFPKTLYTLKYKVKHKAGRFSSKWITKTFDVPNNDSLATIQRGRNRLDFLDVSHSTNFNISPFLYLQGRRVSVKEPYEYSVANLVGPNTTLENAHVTKTIRVQTKTPFPITTRSWSNGKNCKKLSEWSQTFRNTFHDLLSARVENVGVKASGEIFYHIYHPQRLPRMNISISKYESIFKYILKKSTIRNDETFQGRLYLRNTTWSMIISGTLTSCPGFFTLQIIDEVDEVKVLEQDVVILCPETGFEMEIHIPRKNLQDKERLFSILLFNSKQKLKFQLALVDKDSRKRKKTIKKYNDEKSNPWLTLMPLFVVTGCVLLGLLAIMIYAQISHKPEVKERPPRWTFIEYTNKEPKDGNRLKRRHLILIVFLVVVRIVYSFVFTLSVAFAILTLLHGHNLKTIQEYQDFVQSKIDESNAMALRMDQHREGEVKRILEAVEDIERSCDFFLGLQLQWLRFNITCIIQENHLKIFNKLSKKIAKRVTEEIQSLKKEIEERINVFEARTKRKLEDVETSLSNYGTRVYDNKWFILPKGTYNIKDKFERKKRDIAAIESRIQKQNHYEKEASSGLSRHEILTRMKRSIADNSFIGFLDYVGVVDLDKFVEIENNFKSKIQFAKDGLADFTEVLKTGKSPEHPFAIILMCPLRFMLNYTKEQLKRGIREIKEEGEEWAKSKASCFVGNVSDFFAANTSTLDYILQTTDFSERVIYENVHGLNVTVNVSQTNKSSLIESARGGSFFNIEEGDILEEQVDRQKREFLEKEGKIHNVTSAYDAEVFLVTRKAVLSVIYIIDILILIYRGSKTYHLVISLIEGFEEIVEHDEDEFQDKPPSTKERGARLVRRGLDVLAEAFSAFLTFCKALHKKIMLTNMIPGCIIIAASAAVIYLLIVVVFNVMNVTVIEELGGYDLIASRLDTDYNFTNLAIVDQVDFINNNELRLYKESVNKTINEYNKMIANFNKGQQERIETFKRQLCSLESDGNTCFKKIQALTATLLNFNIESCLIPTLEGTPYENYDGEAYRQRLKQGSKRFVDAVRNIVLETIFFIMGVALLIIIITFLSFVVFLFLKSRGMVRVKEVHLYKVLPPHKILRKFNLEFPKYDEDQGDEKTVDTKERRKLKVPSIFVSKSS